MMREVHFAVLVVVAGLLMPCASAAQTFELDSTKGLPPHDVTVDAVSYHRRKAVRVKPATVSQGPRRLPMLADSLVWPSGKPLIHQSTNVFICTLRTVVPTTRCGGITRRSTSPCRSTSSRVEGCRRIFNNLELP